MKIKELLSDESKWTQYCMARDSHNSPVEWYGPNAVKWCLVGAIHKCYAKARWIDIMEQIADKMAIENVKESIEKEICNLNDNYYGFESIKQIVDELDI